MKIFDITYLNDLTGQAKDHPRLRQHSNIHQNYQDACQRLFNAIEPGSYIRPHRHASDPRDELLVAIRGVMTLMTFDDQGSVTGILRFGSDKHGSDLAVGAEVASSTWHTVVALEPGCVLLEVKAGPFDPNQPKDLASWAPEEGSTMAQGYLQGLAELAGKFTGPETTGAWTILGPKASSHRPTGS
jgi:cupin fold WbuC family metalloprotein